MWDRIFQWRSNEVYSCVHLVSFKIFFSKIVSLQIRKWNKNANNLQLNCRYLILLAMCLCGVQERRTFIFFCNLKSKSQIDYFLSTRRWKNDRQMMTSVKWRLSLQVNTESRTTKHSQQLPIRLQTCTVLHVILLKKRKNTFIPPPDWKYIFFKARKGFKVWIQIVADFWNY